MQNMRNFFGSLVAGGVLAVNAAASAQLDEVVTGLPGSCLGAIPTIYCAGGLCSGTAGADVIQGSAFADQIYAGGGNDVVCGAGGNDTIYGQGGNDFLFGQAGADTISGGAGDDHIHGNGGNDTLTGSMGADRILGGDGTDSIDGGSGDDRIVGGNQADTLSGGPGSDLIYGEAGGDSIHADDGNDEVFGGDGSDQIEGGPGNDQLFGQSGSDTLQGQAGADVIGGGTGNDVLQGGTGDDKLDGDSGNDQIFGGSDDDQLYGDTGNADLCDGQAGTDKQIGSTCETVVAIELPAPPDVDPGPGINAACLVWEQDCARGLKCTTSGVDDDFSCQPIADNPGQVGDSCEALRQGDTCDLGSMCINEVCVSLCQGTAEAPVCGSNQACHFYASGLALCEDQCDPLLASACPDGWLCSAEPDALEVFTCAAAQPSEDVPAQVGSTCTSTTQCDGDACVFAGGLPFDYCDDNGALSCCTPFCDLDEPEVCGPGLVCLPFYVSPPPGLEHVGVCGAF